MRRSCGHLRVNQYCRNVDVLNVPVFKGTAVDWFLSSAENEDADRLLGPNVRGSALRSRQTL
ncbi:hypothetical protein T265_04926 [Opisthorchis viverrini]|uniref:Uncharacterized protein n=1 Tax=Opisthorchis viverrini TaxID=6198 RepID=A0A074ZY00_OPIVI|nr:hypothetical protein T265_04926 [Opisthorchis viverrini]KER28165.1 hypothetical protein T265_04926 [Opisthorchis viverrini]